MIRKVFIFVAFMCMMLFEAIPDHPTTDPKDFYDLYPILDDHLVTWQTYVYCLMVQVCFMMFAYIIWMLDKENSKFMRGFFYVTIFYLIEYVLHYSSTWYRTEYFDFSSHLLTVVYLGVLLDRE